MVRAHGGPDVMQWEDLDLAEPGPGEIKIRQTAVGLNFVDIYQRTGLYKQALPFVPGNEAAGVVTLIGQGVSEFRPGDRIAYSNHIGAYAEERLFRPTRRSNSPTALMSGTLPRSCSRG